MRKAALLLAMSVSIASLALLPVAGKAGPPGKAETIKAVMYEAPAIAVINYCLDQVLVEGIDAAVTPVAMEQKACAVINTEKSFSQWEGQHYRCGGQLNDNTDPGDLTDKVEAPKVVQRE